MTERFTIIDYTTNPAGDSTVIDEPVGWDGIALRLKRDTEWHGFFDFFDDSVASLQFDMNAGFEILTAAYNSLGLLAKVELLIEFQCAEGDTFQQLYLGRFVFGKYKSYCGDRCYVECGIEAINCLMQFRNRYDQQVDLDSLNSFDDPNVTQTTSIGAQFFNTDSRIDFAGNINWMKVGMILAIAGTASNNGNYTINYVNHFTNTGGLPVTTVHVNEAIVNEAPVSASVTAAYPIPNLTAYTALNQTILLPSKTIKLTSEWQTNVDAVYGLTDIQAVTPVTARFALTPDWANKISEIENTKVGAGIFIEGTGTPAETFDEANPPDPAIYFTGNNGGGSLRCIGNATAELKFSYNLYHPSVLIDEFRVYVVRDINFAPPYAGLINPPTGSTMTNQAYWDLDSTVGNHAFEKTVNFQINEGETVWIFFTVKVEALFTHLVANLSFLQTSYFKVTVDSACNASPASIYFVNETMSRCVESTTNDCMRVFSDYFGRTNAQPYSSTGNGCGSKRAVINGLKIRNAPVPDGFSQPRMTVSMKDMFDALNCTDNIGMGLEDDGARPGNKLIRVEPFDFFYKPDILMTCDRILNLEREVHMSMIYSTVKAGYLKFETWNDNGLFDIFAGRQYRTELSELKNELDITCKFIASDYTIEITRRLYGSTTSDWRYDADIFFLCLSNTISPTALFVDSSGEYQLNLLPEAPSVTDFTAGDSITVTNSVGNDGTYTIVSVTELTGGVLKLVLVEPVTSSIVAETITITNNTTPLTGVEQGIDNASNIIFPESVMNYRIAPSRNMMRWLKRLLMSYRQYLTGKLRFTQGTGNIVAQGLVLNADGCRIENQIIQEKMDIDLSLFTTPADNYPLFWPELVKFDYPMSYADYLAVVANPYGLIAYSCGNADIEYGWIEDMRYSPYNGMVSFTLRPKI